MTPGKQFSCPINPRFTKTLCCAVKEKLVARSSKVVHDFCYRRFIRLSGAALAAICREKSHECSWKYRLNNLWPCQRGSCSVRGCPLWFRRDKPASGSSAAAPFPSAKPSGPAGTPAATVDVAAVLTKLAASNKERLDWQKSIVDLMKLLNLDSSLAARKELADELHFNGDKNDTASMNIWLHKQVMVNLAENGGKVPDELRT
jgi:Domain of unknown function (DUF3597)